MQGDQGGIETASGPRAILGPTHVAFDGHSHNLRLVASVDGSTYRLGADMVR
jgi:hypothetical protein